MANDCGPNCECKPGSDANVGRGGTKGCERCGVETGDEIGWATGLCPPCEDEAPPCLSCGDTGVFQGHDGREERCACGKLAD